MEIDDLERNELVRLAELLSERLGKSITSELVLELRVDGLEKALDAPRKVVFWENRVKQLSIEAQDWEKACKQAEELMYEARNELAEANTRIKNLETCNKQLYDTGKGYATEVDELKQKCEIFRANEKRLERELMNARATVMNELSAMIPKAVEAERAACADIARKEALKSGDFAESSAAMRVVNEIKARGSE